jgi:flavin-dependent dehydrogenase
VRAQADRATDAGCHTRTDVLIIGGGPAGSTTANLLAGRGYRVALLESGHHPRFHIGESLLPANRPLFELLGVAERVHAIGQLKWGAEFVSPWHGRSETFEFAAARNPDLPYSYQVRRSQFDEILIRRAAECGALVVEGCRAREVDLERPDGGVRVMAEHDDGTRSSWEARFLVDASGRATFLANHLHVKRRNSRHNSAAIYAHFAGVERRAGKRAGDISIYWFEHGWFWLIPLADGATSVGAVVWPYYLKRRHGPLPEFMLETIALCAPLAERMKNATLISEVEATGNYSYSAARSHGRNYLLVGDAFAFVDPVFSSGVWLAMHGGVVAADTTDACLRTPERASAALRVYDRVTRRGPRMLSWFIYRVTNPTLRDLLMTPKNPLRVRETLLSVLAGDIFGETPIRASLAAFKAVYYLASLFNLPRTLAAARRRRLNIAPAASDQAAA